MTRLTAEGASAYIDTSLWAHDAGMLSIGPLRLRMRFVQQHGEPNTVTHRLANDIAGEEAPEEAWPDEPKEAEREMGRPEGITIVDSGNEEDPLLLRLIPAGATGMSMWYFNQYDPDFFPSIPHGHHTTAHPEEKLDAYLGYVYRGSTQIRREPRMHIVALWNDAKFRKFSRTAIHWYAATYPNYRWRVQQWWTLPRVRP
jgi:hypothetical protein